MKNKLLITAAAIYLAILIRPEILLSVWGALSGAVVPIIWGIIFAVIINPAVCKAEHAVNKLSREKVSSEKAKFIAIAVVYVIIVTVIAAVIRIVIPKLWESAALFANSIDGYYSNFTKRYDELSSRDNFGILSMAERILESVSENLPDIFGKTFTATAGFVKSTANLLVGLVLSVYILAQKEQLTDFIKGAAHSAMNDKGFNRASRVLSAVNSSMVAFIGGQLTEAVVLGSLCFIGMIIFGFEYPLLISTIIGITALIPVVGAFIGTIPSAFVLFLIKPSSALWFVVFIIILQQLENNFIYPRVVGKSVGLPPILILTAIIVGVQLGGVWGIMLGIPLLSAVYLLVRESIENKKNTEP